MAPEGVATSPTVVVCTECGLVNHAGTRFCRSCSAFLEWSGQALEVPDKPVPSVAEGATDPTQDRLAHRVWDWVVFGQDGQATAKAGRGVDSDTTPSTEPTASASMVAPPAEDASRVIILAPDAGDDRGVMVVDQPGASAEAAAPPPPAPDLVVTPDVVGAAPAPAVTATNQPTPTVEVAEAPATVEGPATEPATEGPVIRPVRPDEQPAPRVHVAPAVMLEDDTVAHDLTCRSCGTGNPAGRHFCRRCAQPLTGEAAPPRMSRWLRYRQGRRQRREAKALLRLGERPRLRRQLIGGTSGGWASSIAVRVMMLGAVAVMALSFIGPYARPIRSHVSSWYTTVRQSVHPTYAPVEPVGATATSALPGHAPLAAIDGESNTYWAAASPTAVGQGLTISFAKPERIDRIGFLLGAQDQPQNYLTQPRPQVVHLAFSDGTSEDLTLVDQSAFQAFAVKARKASAVHLTVESTFDSPFGHNVAITEVEFFSKK
ncbi:MAG TPA: hypothetical protein VFA11_14565 [Acidimicrobiales bacterium]|nr:hypothetical protein [Acidimicrobiales bacterium]